MKFHIETACLPPLLQSTCTTAYMEAESAYMPNVQVVSQFRCSPETNKNEKLVIMNAERAMPESSFRISSPGGTFLHHRIVEQHMLNHSDYSPFSRSLSFNHCSLISKSVHLQYYCDTEACGFPLQI